ncbi:MAG: sulfotransferase [Paracoccaceae bacterium]
MSAPPVPVFVLGIQRSGTTLAANLLAAHPEIAAVVAARHQGVHESVFFSHFARVFGPWQNNEARARAAEAFCRSDYARLAGQCGAECEAAMRAAPSPEAAFRAVMDRLAREQKARAGSRNRRIIRCWPMPSPLPCRMPGSSA